MIHDSTIYDGSISDTFALDTSDTVLLGAPAPLGTERIHAHPTYGRQVYKLFLNESGSSLVAYEATQLGAGTAVTGATCVQRADAGTLKIDFAGFPQNAIGDDFWGWHLVEGEGLAAVAASAAQDAPLECIAGGEVDDSAGGDNVAVLIAATLTGADDVRVLVVR